MIGYVFKLFFILIFIGTGISFGAGILQSTNAKGTLVCSSYTRLDYIIGTKLGCYLGLESRKLLEGPFKDPINWLLEEVK